MRDLESAYRVVKMLYAINIFIKASKGLTSDDIDTLEKIAKNMKNAGKVEPKEMTISEIEKLLRHPVKIVKEENRKC